MISTIYLLLACCIPFTSGRADVQEPPHMLIPQPVSYQTQGEPFRLNSALDWDIDPSFNNPSLVLAHLKRWQETYALQQSDAAPFTVRLSFSEDLPAEGYELHIEKSGIHLTAGDEAGLFYGIQSLRQLSWSSAPGDNTGITLPQVTITDYPAFPYRGMHLDVGRHFFPVETIKTYLDLLATYKMNRFHWHLTEDQGWRIEIKKYPKLQEVAAYRSETLVGHYNDRPFTYDGKKYGGYYTQEEVKEIVAYAAERSITVIPEIELPGHAQAAIAAYPELGCTKQPIEVATKWGIYENIYCPTETTFQFLEDVLTEVMSLFPSEYIHIGGDEAPKSQWKSSAFCQELIKKEGLKDEHELQSYFIQRIEKFLNSNGRQLIGWDEILEGGLAPNATVMSWRGESGGIEAAKQGHDVIMTPTTYCYFDYYQSVHPDEPLAIGGFLPLEKVYGYHPIPQELSESEATHILGAQGNVWTEYIATPEKMFYMALPRMQALAEVVWTPAEQKDYSGFTHRLDQHFPVWERMGIKGANHLYDAEVTIGTNDHDKLILNASNAMGKGSFRVVRTAEDIQEELDYEGPFAPESGHYTIQSIVDGEPRGRSSSITFYNHLLNGAALELTHQPHPKYNGQQPEVILNGVSGSDQRYGDSEWIGMEGDDLEAIITTLEPVEASSLHLRFFHSPGQWVYAPTMIRFSYWIPETNQWSVAFERTVDSSDEKVIEVKELFTREIKGQRFKLEVQNFGEIPDGAQGAGHRAWLFVDEIRLQ